jgi:hypothetical protein
VVPVRKSLTHVCERETIPLEQEIFSNYLARLGGGYFFPWFIAKLSAQPQGAQDAHRYQCYQERITAHAGIANGALELMREQINQNDPRGHS